MNIVFMLLLSFYMTVRGIQRIPVKPIARTLSDEDYFSELVDENPQINHSLADISVEATTKTNIDFKFTDFILEAVKILKTYEDKELKNAFEVIDETVCKDEYKGCKAKELAVIKRYASEQFTKMKDAPAGKIRQNLDHIINLLSYEDFGEIRDVVDYVNTLYVGEKEKFIEILLALVHRRISEQVDLAAVLEDALNMLIFDHYCTLDDQVRRDLIKVIKHYWRQFISKIVSDKSSNKDNLPFVTPFVNERSLVDVSKKHRFNTVNSGKPILKRWTDSKNRKSRRSSGYQIDLRNNSVEGFEDFVESVESESKKVVSTESENLRNPVSSTRMISTTKLIYYSPENNLINKTLQPNNTIEKLINIGKLATDIKELMASKDEGLQNGDTVTSWDWDYIFRTNSLELMSGDAPVTGEMIKLKEEDEKKTVVLSMKAQYQGKYIK